MKIDKLTPDSVVLKELGQRLSRVRKQQKYSQESLAAEAGLGVATLRRIEDGRDSQLGSWLKILKALQMSSSIEMLLPETFMSPMAEVFAEKKVSSNKTAEKKAVPNIWGDEQDSKNGTP